MDIEQGERMKRTLWSTLVQLKRVCVLLRLPAHARAVGKLLDQMEEIMDQEDAHGTDEKGYTTIQSEEEVDGLDERSELRR